MSDPWYGVVEAKAPLSQGDLILSCPISSWNEDISPAWNADGTVSLNQDEFIEDVILMTQACDLENDKLKNVILCLAEPLSQFQDAWRAAMKARGQEPSAKAWSKFLDSISKGHQWNYTLLNSFRSDGISTEIRVVNFHEVYTLPKVFLESFLARHGMQRLQLLSPYREHLSQSFARFFMRVGLPTAIEFTV